jgi:hypothetical protein
MSASAFGMKACRDPNFVADLRRGRKPNIDLCDQVQRWMAGRDRRRSSKSRPKDEAEPART